MERIRTVTAAWVAAAVVITGCIVFVAVRSDGAIATNVQLDDGIVWVTNQQLGMVGRLNVEIDEIDTAVLGSPLGIDVVQQARRVVFAGEMGGVQRLDVANGGAVGNNQVPIVDYQMAGGVAVVYDQASGAVWTSSDENIAGATYPDQPDALIEPGSKVIVTAATAATRVPGVEDRAALPDRGKVMVLGNDGWRELLLDQAFAPVRADANPEFVPETSLLPPTTLANEPPPTVPPDDVYPMEPARAGASLPDVAEITAVGGRPVILTNELTVVVDEEHAVELEGEQGRLQQVSDDSDAVFVATDRALFRVELGGERRATIVASRGGGEPIGVPSQPVQVGPCAYAAWTSASPAFVRWCDGDEVLEPQAIPGAQPDVELTWRVNQRTVALNSPGNGDAWADHDGALTYVGNWSDVEPEPNSDTISESLADSDIAVDRRCQEGYLLAPVAGDDKVGVRPRQSTIEVLNNDDDFDCEPFRISSVSPADGDFGALTIIDAGQRLLWSPSEEFIRSGGERFGFKYVLTDEAGHRSEPANVSVTVVPDDENRPPELLSNGPKTKREMKSVVEEGHSTSYDVLADWTDPDGDTLDVTAAVVDGNGAVSITREGAVTFEANGVPPGASTVAVTVSDGRDQATAEWLVTVAPRGTELGPTAQDDFVLVGVGSTVTIDPLANDSDPNEDDLALQPLWTDAEGIGTRTLGGQVVITPKDPGIYRLDYAANDGTSADPGKASILVTAVESTGSNTAPVAVPDKVSIRSGRVLNIDVLENDVDPDGDALAIADVSASDGIRATVVDRHLVQVEVPNDGVSEVASSQRFSVTYRIVDGHEAERSGATGSADAGLRAIGTVQIDTIPADQDMPPVLRQDQLTVRSGTIASVKVLANDSDPDTDELKVTALDEQQVSTLEDAGQVVVWADESQVYAYGVEPGLYSIAYAATANGVSVSSEVAITVTAPADPEANPNRSPEPPRKLVRAVRGSTVRVQLPLNNSDPDGDPVRLIEGLGATEAGRGNSVEVDPEDPTVVLFTAGLNSPSSDAFTYTVADQLGARATGDVDVVVIDDEGLGPQAHDDVYVVKPGRTLVVPALDNDTSPQDNELAFDDPPFFDLDGQPSALPINRGAVKILDQSDPDREGMMTVVAPTDRSTVVERYRVTDGVSSSSAFVRVTPDPEAPNRGPLVSDDTVEPDALRELGVGDEYGVDVLVNDLDADDADNPQALTVTVPTFQNARAEGNEVIVTLADHPQTVAYRATDADGASAVGLIRVSALGNRPPELSEVGRDPEQRVIPAGADSSLRVNLADIVIDPDGDEVAFTDTTPRVVDGAADLEADADGFDLTPRTGPEQSAEIAVEIEVTDRPLLTPEERQDPQCNCVSVLVVRSLVDGSAAPRVIRKGAVDLPQLEEPVSYDISPLIVDEDGDELTYEFLEDSSEAILESIDGSVLRLVSQTERNIGDQITLQYTASDGVNDPVSNVVVVTIVDSNKPVPRTAELGPFDAIQGEDLALPNLLDAAFNPFDGQPLTLTDWNISGDASLSCSSNGACTFRTDSNSILRTSATYTIADALGREASGTFEVNVKGRPLAPPAPQIESVGDRQVTLSWTQPDLRGGELREYRVKVVETGQVRSFFSTGGTVTELTNYETYRFQVQAVNEVGEGEWSPPSSGATPDRAPDPPINLGFPSFDDSVLTLSWSPPSTTDEYSPITNFQIKLSDGQIFDLDASATELVVGAGGSGSALQNGRDYTFQARSRNSAEQNNGWSEWSAPSPSESPARYPDPPTNAVVVHAGGATTPQARISWSAPEFDGGRPLKAFKICEVNGRTECIQAAAGTNQRDIPLTAGTTYQFQVTAKNILDEFGLPNESEPVLSGTITAVGNPDPPILSSQGPRDHEVRVDVTPTNGSGCADAPFVEYSYDGGPWTTNNVKTGVPNGVPVSVVARNVLPSTCGTPGVQYVSQPSNQVTVTPLGPPPTVNVSIASISRSFIGKTTIRWEVVVHRGQDGLGTATLRLEGLCGGEWSIGEDRVEQRVGTATFDNAGQTLSCRAVVSTSAGPSNSDQDSHSAWPAPSKSLGDPVVLNHYIPNHSYTFRCYWLGIGTKNFSGTTDDNGHLSKGRPDKFCSSVSGPRG